MNWWTRRDAIIISCMDTFTSMLAGVTIFSILGNLAFETGRDVSEVAGGGPGLAFVSYPDAIAKFNVLPQVFGIRSTFDYVTRDGGKTRSENERIFFSLFVPFVPV